MQYHTAAARERIGPKPKPPPEGGGLDPHRSGAGYLHSALTILSLLTLSTPPPVAPAGFFMLVSLAMLVSFSAPVSTPADVPVTVTLWPTCCSSLTVLLVNEYAFPSAPLMVKVSLALPLDRQPVTLVGACAAAGDVIAPATRATAAASRALLVPIIASLLRAALRSSHPGR